MDKTEFNRLHSAPYEDGVASLYKFKAFDEKNPQHVTDIFEHGLLYFPTPEQLNDPWECQSTVEMPVTLQETASAKRRLMESALRRGMDGTQADAFAETMLADPTRFIDAVKIAVKNSTRDIRIASFAAERDSPLLWAHYANSHQGICIEFSSETKLYTLAHRVKYQKNYPSFKYPHELYEILSIILTKSDDWDYEREYRTFNIPGSPTQLKLDNGKFRLANTAISKVYFGALMQRAHQDQIIESIQKGPFTPELYKATLRTDAYQLDYRRIVQN